MTAVFSWMFCFFDNIALLNDTNLQNWVPWYCKNYCWLLIFIWEEFGTEKWRSVHPRLRLLWDGRQWPSFFKKIQRCKKWDLEKNVGTIWVLTHSSLPPPSFRTVDEVLCEIHTFNHGPRTSFATQQKYPVLENPFRALRPIRSLTSLFLKIRLGFLRPT